MHSKRQLVQHCWSLVHSLANWLFFCGCQTRSVWHIIRPKISLSSGAECCTLTRSGAQSIDHQMTWNWVCSLLRARVTLQKSLLPSICPRCAMSCRCCLTCWSRIIEYCIIVDFRGVWWTWLANFVWFQVRVVSLHVHWVEVVQSGRSTSYLCDL